MKKKRFTWTRILSLYLPIVIILLFLIFPFYWTFVTSVKPESELYGASVTYWPKHFSFDSYKKLFSGYNFLHPMFNSFLVAMITTLVTLVVSTLAAYAFTRFEFKGKKTLMGMFLTNNMFPTVLLLIPLYTMMRKINLLYSPFSPVLLLLFLPN